jgi:hypothetical protein
VRLSDEELARYVGTYETIILLCEIVADDGQLVATLSVKPEMRETLREAGQDPDEVQPPLPLGLLSVDGDKYVISDGPAKGMKGYFQRDAAGTVDAVHLGGRLATRVTSLVS